MKTYKLATYKGINDLKNTCAYIGSWGQGDHYGSNDCSITHPSYVSFQFDCEETQEAVDKEVKRREDWNAKHVAELKASGEYGKEDEPISITLMPLPEYDDPKPLETSKESYRFTILNLNQ